MKNFKLEMKKIGSIFFVEVGFYKLKTQKYGKCWLGLDTGAGVTTLSKDLVYNLGYSIAGSPLKRIITASGIEDVNVIILEKIKLGDFELNDIEIYTLDFPNDFLIGVLGLNVLANFDVNFLFS